MGEPMLKSCPFCGSPDVADFFAVTGDPYIGCSDCDARGGAFVTKEQAIEAWNTRASVLEVQRLSAALLAARQWMNDNPPIGTPGTITAMRAIDAALAGKCT